MGLKAFKYRLYPTTKQTQTLQWTLERCRELYNAALQERRDAYRMAGKSIIYYDQANQLPEIKQIREEYQDVHSQVLQDVLRKADKAFQAFFVRCKRGETPGYPRYKGKGHYDSFTYPQAGFSLTHDNHVCLSKIGSIKVKLHRPISTIVFEELQPAHLAKRPKPKQDENGKYLPNGASQKAGLNKSIVDAGWGQFQQYCVSKAANAGRQVLFVNPKYTSQVCSGCGTVKKKELSERWHSCECGCELDRDHNAAINIHRLGRSRQASA